MTTNYIFPIVSGLVLALCFPRFNFFYFAYFSLVPLLISIQSSKKMLDGFKSSLLSGFVFYLVLLYWIVPTIAAAGEGVAIGVLSLVLLSLYMGLYFGIWGIVAKFFMERKMWFLYVSFFWVVLEYIKNYFLSGFPWMLLGYSQWKFLDLIQMSDITGVYGVSFLIVLVNCAVFDVLVRKRYPAVLCAVLLFVIYLMYGFFSFKKLELGENEIRVAMLQGSIDQYKKWDKRYVEEIIGIYTDLAKDARNVDLVIWPESAVPGYLFLEKELLSWMEKIVKESNVYHLVGSVDAKPGGIYNSCFLFSPEFKLLGEYSKIHLTPFGEYVPLQSVLGKFVKVLNELGGFTPGEKFRIFDFKNEKFGVFICFESVFPNLVRVFTKRGVNFLVNITNDAWFLKTAAPEQHFINCVFRAIENRKFIIRVGNTGISGIIDPFGRVISRSDLFQRACFFGGIKPNEFESFYVLHGDLFAQFCIILFLLICLREGYTYLVLRKPQESR